VRAPGSGRWLVVKPHRAGVARHWRQQLHAGDDAADKAMPASCAILLIPLKPYILVSPILAGMIVPVACRKL
jgi:hypothetical protein